MSTIEDQLKAGFFPDYIQQEKQKLTEHAFIQGVYSLFHDGGAVSLSTGFMPEARALISKLDSSQQQEVCEFGMTQVRNKFIKQRFPRDPIFEGLFTTGLVYFFNPDAYKHLQILRRRRSGQISFGMKSIDGTRGIVEFTSSLEALFMRQQSRGGLANKSCAYNLVNEVLESIANSNH